jgi:hypothetical protein
MAEKLFILGRPGSGKSAAFRHIKQYIEEKYGWSAVHYSDYDILRDMFLYERLYHFNNKPRQFRATKHDGFDVLDFSVLDKASGELEKIVRSRYSKNEKDELIVIEFARDNYFKALKLFSFDFLKDAHFLFLDVNLNTCIKRVHERVTHPTSEDDHYVSETILKSYYNKQIMPNSIGKEGFKVITNRGTLQVFFEKLDRFVDGILAHEAVVESYHVTVSQGAFHLSLSAAKMRASWSLLTQQKVK